MPFERHRVELVDFMDTLIEQLETDKQFRHFHLDGQTIMLEDYLDIRPQMRTRVEALLRAERLQIGPWYVLQDEYLTSGEAAVRNLQRGLRMCREWGAQPVMVGYFPDAFGNVSQMPQVLTEFGIHTAAFGRGVTNVFDDNVVRDSDSARRSEICWQSPDGSTVLGIMFANWYHNAMELPCEDSTLKNRLETLLHEARPLASTPHLLGMNGCDHQPVQRDLSAVLEKAQELLPDVRVVHSSFPEYIQAIQPYTQQFQTVVGEINSQQTSGYGALINTASSRVDLKQANFRTQTLLERYSEPLQALLWWEEKAQDSDLLMYAWKTLLQNHPHDSICCCSVDEVHAEMKTRSMRAQQVGECIMERAAKRLLARIDTSEMGEMSITVFNTDCRTVTDVVTVVIDLPLDREPSGWTVSDDNGKALPCVVESLGKTFTYALPKDSFRKVTYVNRYRMTLTCVDVPGLGYHTYPLRFEQPAADEWMQVGDTWAETDIFRVDFHPNGTLRLYDKRQKRTFDQNLLLEDCDDDGNEYTFKQREKSPVYTTQQATATVRRIRTNAIGTVFQVECSLREQIIQTQVTIFAHLPRIDCSTRIFNTLENHRIRVLFPTALVTEHVFAGGVFDVCKRRIAPHENWKNPSHCQRMTDWVALEEELAGLLLATRGLYEYEVLQDDHNTLALTLLRCVGELGDWGVFPTPDSQCKGQHVLEYSLISYHPHQRAQAYSDADVYCHSPLQAYACAAQKGDLRPSNTYVSVENPYLRFSAFKMAENSKQIAFRIFNQSNDHQTSDIYLHPDVKNVFLAGIDETEKEELSILKDKIVLTVPPKKIVTLLLERVCKRSCQ